MFVGFLREGFNDISKLQNDNELFDEKLVKNSYASNPQYCFGAYEDKKVVGVLSAYDFGEDIFINALKTTKECQEAKERLLYLLMQNVEEKNIVALIDANDFHIFQPYGFMEQDRYIRYMHSGEAVAFNFSDSLAKKINGDDFQKVSQKITSEVCECNFSKYIKNVTTFSSSLKLSFEDGFLHSYVINKKYVRLSPWFMKNPDNQEAEKLLRGVMYYRGLKRIFAYAPKRVKRVEELYKSYKFKKEKEYILIYLGKKPQLDIDKIYAL